MTVASQLLNTYSRKMATNDMAAYIVIYVECVFALKIVRTSPKRSCELFSKKSTMHDEFRRKMCEYNGKISLCTTAFLTICRSLLANTHH